MPTLQRQQGFQGRWRPCQDPACSIQNPELPMSYPGPLRRSRSCTDSRLSRYGWITAPSLPGVWDIDSPPFLDPTTLPRPGLYSFYLDDSPTSSVMAAESIGSMAYSLCKQWVFVFLGEIGHALSYHGAVSVPLCPGQGCFALLLFHRRNT